MSNSTAPLPTPFATVYQTTCAPLGQNNVDTDQIIPARFLKGTAKTGLGQALFADWRIPPERGLPNLDFVLNQPQYQGAGILIAGHNFGCGSSREHAPWALKDYGFQVILAISFADIFKNNALKNGLLPIGLPEQVILDLLERVKASPKERVSINLAAQQVDLPLTPDGAPMQLHFELDPYRKTCLLQGLDDIGYTLRHLPEIEAFEETL